jgi:GDPmannose 4,6-dehydratase
MLQQEKPDDYVVATGETYSVAKFLDETFKQLGLDWKKSVEQDARYFRPAEVDLLLGDPSKAKKLLKWEPKVKFTQLVKMMVDADMKLAEQEKILVEAGHRGRGPETEQGR